MNKCISKKTFILINIIIFIVEIILLYLLISAYLNNDFISPNDITFYEYLLNKLNNML